MRSNFDLVDQLLMSLPLPDFCSSAKKTDIRSPHPGLNAAANHFFNRNSIVTFVPSKFGSFGLLAVPFAIARLLCSRHWSDPSFQHGF